MSKKLRTPIIMPRKQGGTFYTFSSAMEDIGLNINESHNCVEISHYVLLDIPNFSNDLIDGDPYLFLKSELDYDSKEYTVDSSTQGDFIFADQFQNYCLNFETVLRNQDNYNYASNKTVSERVFWKWLFGRMKNDNNRFITDGDYIYEDKAKSIAKAFGTISAGSQRTDDSGLYNETFVQIPSSYGQMRVLFKKVIDENYLEKSYSGTNESRQIENIDESEITSKESDNVIAFTVDLDEFQYPEYGTIITERSTGSEFKVVNVNNKGQLIGKFIGKPKEIPDSGFLTINGKEKEYSSFDINCEQDFIKSTGISPYAKSDSAYGKTSTYIVNENVDYDKIEVEFDINALRSYYGNDSLTIDDIGMGKTSNPDVDHNYGNFEFNAILVYYSIYDAKKIKRLATNAYGLYILDGALDGALMSPEKSGTFYFPRALKAKFGNNDKDYPPYKDDSKYKKGSSYSFRINVRPSTAYSGDITVFDNSTAGYGMSEDFNDVLRNLSSAITTMKENAKTLYSISQDNKNTNMMVSAAMEKINSIESDISSIKNGKFPNTTTDNTTYTVASSSSDGLMSKEDYTKLRGIANNANNYTHPDKHPASMITGLANVATTGSYNDLTDKPDIQSTYTLPGASDTELGGIKTNYQTTNDRNYAVKVDKNNNAYVNVPWTDTKTTYSTFDASNNGLVPAPVTVNVTKFLCSDGKWKTPADAPYIPGTGISIDGTTVSNTGVISIEIDKDSADTLIVNNTKSITIDEVTSASNAGHADTAGTAATAEKLTTSDGSTNTPVYFKDGKPVALSYTIEASVPQNANFSNTTYTLSMSSSASSNTIKLTPSSGDPSSIKLGIISDKEIKDTIDASINWT